MGLGIAQVSAIAGHKVLLYDVSLPARAVALEKLQSNLEKLKTKGKILEQNYFDSLQNFQIVDALESLNSCDLIIEAVKEDYLVKENLFAEVSKINPTAIIATNTSSLSVTRLSNSVINSKRFIGMHFMNPVPLMPLVEIIEHQNSECSTVELAVNFCATINKQVVKCKDSPAFIINRLLLPMINQAINLLDQGIAEKVDIDRAMHLGANFPMGPLALADFIGLDTCLFILETIYNEEANTNKPAELLVNMVNAGKFGKKSGQGFYTYN